MKNVNGLKEVIAHESYGHLYEFRKEYIFKNVFDRRVDGPY